MVSEEDLIKLIMKDFPSKSFSESIKSGLRHSLKDKLKHNIYKIIQLLYSDERLEFGKYLSNYKETIIAFFYKNLTKPTPHGPLLLLTYLKNINKYGILVNFLKEPEETNTDKLYDFFRILRDDKNIKEVLNKYFYKSIKKQIPHQVTIENVDELIDLINESMCYKNENYDYQILYDYIMKKKEEKKIQRKKEIKELKSVKKNSQNIIKIDRENDGEKKTDNKSPCGENLGKISQSCDSKKIISDSNNISENIKSGEIHDKNLHKNGENIINDIKLEPNTLKDYYLQRKKYYSEKGYETPFLDRLINGELIIGKELFALKKPDEHLFEPHYPNLEKLIHIFADPKQFKKNVLNTNEYGYVCTKKYNYKDKKYYYKEGIYATLENNELYKEITDKNKFQKDDIYDSNQSFTDNCFKARGLSLEYYLNGLFMDLLRQKQLPRVIYNFNPIKLNNEKDEEKKEENEIKDVIKEENEIKEVLEEENEKVPEEEFGGDIPEEEFEEVPEEEFEEVPEEEIEENVTEKDIKASSEKTKKNNGENTKRCIEMEELDGVFYLETKKSIEIEQLPFIIDDILEIEDSTFKYTAQNSKSIEFGAKTLFLLEVKNKFPELENVEKELFNVFNKAMTFYELYKERFSDIEKIRIIFFYDSVIKKNYDKILNKSIQRYFNKKKNIKYKVQFQFIFITSSYLSFNYQYLNQRIDILVKEIMILQKAVAKIQNEKKEKNGDGHATENDEL